ncbi:hypothetical protein V8C34DRAFT_280888 [Trichoderma compactum]
MYHLWYTDELEPFMATKLLKIQPLSAELVNCLQVCVTTVLETGIDAALRSYEGRKLVASFQAILDDATKDFSGPIFVRLGATSAKDSFANGAPTAKPSPLPPNSDLVLRRLLSSGRVTGRLLALADCVWADDPGEALIVQQWSPDVEIQREIRVFCFAGHVTAISQDVWWEKSGWRDRYSDGFVQAIINLWGDVKGFLPFDTCTMDVLMTPPSDQQPWTAKIIEFNGFGAHLNTGSDLFHWVSDNDILQGKSLGVVVRFVDDWDDDATTAAGDSLATTSESTLGDGEEPDWAVLERELQAKYSEKNKDEKRMKIERVGLPLNGRWCSAY